MNALEREQVRAHLHEVVDRAVASDQFTFNYGAGTVETSGKVRLTGDRTLRVEWIEG